MTIEYINADTERTWYVVFEPRRGKFHFWHLFTRGGFDHVWAFTEINDSLKPFANGVVALCPTMDECLVKDWLMSPDELISKLPDDVTAILKYKSKYSAFNTYRLRGIVSCVTLVKSLLGIGGFCVTPLGLYRQLKKKGAKNGKQ